MGTDRAANKANETQRISSKVNETQRIYAPPCKECVWYSDIYYQLLRPITCCLSNVPSNPSSWQGSKCMSWVPIMWCRLLARISHASPSSTYSTAVFPVESHQFPVESNEELPPSVPPQFSIIFASFKDYMCSIEVGSKARLEMFVLGACQVMETVSMDYACLSRWCV